ncbi:hypothetical protein B0H21DRAFT_215601 [Amylocystis lapponica]|nr:hypothetical protein B0H21DRAFT_215601 [Amylocystis lapponica]
MVRFTTLFSVSVLAFSQTLLSTAIVPAPGTFGLSGIRPAPAPSERSGGVSCSVTATLVTSPQGLVFFRIQRHSTHGPRSTDSCTSDAQYVVTASYFCNVISRETTSTALG